VGADADRKSDFSVLRNSELGGASCGVAARLQLFTTKKFWPLRGCLSLDKKIADAKSAPVTLAFQ
jgi:hypothetical protein